jgi:DNA sulfur modification protein DndB
MKRKTNTITVAPIGPYMLTLPAIRGIQSGREYYVTMVPLGVLSKYFQFNEGGLPAELRAQRVINRARIPEIARYILNNPNDYVFSAITASVDCNVNFSSIHDYGPGGWMGVLSVPTDTRFLINDGQHRKAAVDAAIKQNPELARETMAVVLFVDAGLKRSQQMFADLNKYAIRPTRSLGVLYDYKDSMAEVVRSLIVKVPLFKDRIEKEKTTISNRSKNLFTLSAIYQATKALLGKRKKFDSATEEEIRLAIEFWSELPKHIPEWKLLLNGRMTSADLRRDYVHSHGVLIHALGSAGNALILQHPYDWENRLSKLEEIDWSRSNPEWEGRAIMGGRLSKAIINVILVTNYIKKEFGLPLSKEEQKIESKHLKGKI